MKKTILLSLVAVLAVAAIGVGAFFLTRDRNNNAGADGFTQIAITLKDGKPVDLQEHTYGTGAKLEFKVSSDKHGKVTIASDTPQTIVLTESPLTFRLTVTKNGEYPITFQKDGDSDPQAATITTIHIK